MNRHLIEENIQIENKHMNWFLTSLAIREEKIKNHDIITHISERLHKQWQHACWWGWEETRSFIYCLWECTMVQRLWKTLDLKNKTKKQNPKHATTLQPTNCTPRHFPREVKMYVYSRFIHSGNKLETTQIDFDRLMLKLNVVHPYHGILLSNKKKPIDIFENLSEFPDNYAEWKKPNP